MRVFVVAALAGALAAAVSWAGNRAALKLLGTRVIVVLVPLIEETAKTGAAVITGAPIILTHAVFGLIEGFYDTWDRGLQGIGAGAASLAGHLFYGYIANMAMDRTGSFLASVLAGYVVHMVWNTFVMKYMVKERRKA